MRVPRFYPGFIRARDRFGIISGSPLAKRIAGEIRLLCDAELPAAGDLDVLLPPSMKAWSHPVPGTPFSIVYWAEESELRIVTLKLNETS